MRYQCPALKRRSQLDNSDLRALMKSRRGRCGEFANLFTLFLRAIGLRARYGSFICNLSTCLV